MSNAAFNDDQLDYIKSLNKINSKDLCWCGWYKKGHCFDCPKDLSAADKIKIRCSECHSEPLEYGKGKIIHRIKCSKEKL
jgi:hypothetical protein